MISLKIAAPTRWYEEDDKDYLALEEGWKKDVDAGKVLRFARQNRIAEGVGVVKHVSSLKHHEYGDFIAEWSNGSTHYVCPYDRDYTVTVITREEADREQSCRG